MCGRFTLRLSSAELQAFFNLFRADDVSARFNIAPTQLVMTISLDGKGQRLGLMRQWGLIPSWAKDPSIGSKMINARSESVAEKPAFRSAFRSRRCLVPASGFYEWQATGAKVKQPWLILPADGPLLVFAGLWESWKDPTGTRLETCTILTTAPNGMMAEIHDRLPVILDSEAFPVWLDPAIDDAEALQSLLVPCPDEWLEKVPVSTRVSNVRNDDPDCIKPIAMQGDLF